MRMQEAARLGGPLLFSLKKAQRPDSLCDCRRGVDEPM
jgi:hypothetical protein